MSTVTNVGKNEKEIEKNDYPGHIPLAFLSILVNLSHVKFVSHYSAFSRSWERNEYFKQFKKNIRACPTKGANCRIICHERESNVTQTIRISLFSTFVTGNGAYSRFDTVYRLLFTFDILHLCIYFKSIFRRCNFAYPKIFICSGQTFAPAYTFCLFNVQDKLLSLFFPLAQDKILTRHTCLKLLQYKLKLNFFKPNGSFSGHILQSSSCTFY